MSRSITLLLASMQMLVPGSPVEAQAGAPDSVVYTLSPSSSFEVKTGKSGLFRFAGHEHLIRARSPSGHVVFYPSAPQDSRVDLLVQVDSLEVLTPPDTAEIRKVTAAMREDVLRAEQYPEIRFVSTSVAPREGGYRVQGGLTIVGVTREVSIDLTGVVGPDSLRMEGRFSVNQTDFGIRPFRGGPAGVIKVADRVEFHIIAIGTP